MENNLAIIIPAYKGKFLSQTLDALVNQTNQNFNVYIGDDDSPDQIENIIESYRNKLSIDYTKFQTNFGNKNLVKQWMRCINMAKKEDWLWILPDDDVPSENCVAAFFEYSKHDFFKKDLYRFQTVHIDQNNEIIFVPPKLPERERNVDFIIKKIRFERNSSIAEYIFSKTQYFKVGGLTDLPLAWGADDILWYSLAEDHGILTLPVGSLNLRQSNLNISQNSAKFRLQKIKAKYLFFDKLLKDPSFMEKIRTAYSQKRLIEDITFHLFCEYRSYNLSFYNIRLLKFSIWNNKLIGGGILKNMYRLLRYQIRSAR